MRSTAIEIGRAAAPALAQEWWRRLRIVLSTNDGTDAVQTRKVSRVNVGAHGPVERMIRITYAFALLQAIVVYSLSLMKVPAPQRESYFSFYADSFLNEFHGWIGYVVALLCLGAAVYSILKWISSFSGNDGDEERRFSRALRRQGETWLKRSYEALRMTFPIILNLFLLSYVVGYVNAFNQHRLIDPRLAAADYRLTGMYPFLTLEMIRFPRWLTGAVELSFVNLPFLLVIAALFSFFRDRKIFSRFVVAFFVSFAIMTPVWLLVPAMSPQDRFIDNVYHLKDPPRIAAELKDFKPVPQVESFLKGMRKSKEGLELMPTTTFPSSHAAWATLAAVYLVELSPAGALVLGPFLLLSTLGTFYLAQHYFVDTIAGILIGFLSSFIASLLFRTSREESARAKAGKRETPLTEPSALPRRPKMKERA